MVAAVVAAVAAVAGTARVSGVAVPIAIAITLAVAAAAVIVVSHNSCGTLGASSSEGSTLIHHGSNPLDGGRGRGRAR